MIKRSMHLGLLASAVLVSTGAGAQLDGRVLRATDPFAPRVQRAVTKVPTAAAPGWAALPSTTTGRLGRFTPDAPDGSFGAGGTVSLPLFARVGVRDAQGRTWLAARVGPASAQVGFARLQANGALDPTFAVGGAGVLANVPGFWPRQMHVDAQGRVLVVGEIAAPGGTTPYLVRFEASGAVDASLSPSTGGLLTLALPAQRVGNPVRSFASAVDASGRIYVAGAPSDNIRGAFVVRLTASGSIDGSFGGRGDGIQLLGHGNRVVLPTKVLVDDGGRVYVVANGEGVTYQDVPEPGGFTPATHISVWRVDASGALDATWGTGGHALLDQPNVAAFGAYDAFLDVRQATVWRKGAPPPPALPFLVVAGSRVTAGMAPVNHRAMIARFTPTGALDITFGNGGIATPLTNVNGQIERVRGVGRDANGRYVLVGQHRPFDRPSSRVGETNQGFALRVTTDGVQDTSFPFRAFPRVEPGAVVFGPDGAVAIHVP